MRWAISLLLLTLLAAPAHAAVTETVLPAEAKGPLAVAFGAAGSLWVTLDGSWAVGRYSPQSGKLDIARLNVSRVDDQDSLTALAIAADGSVWTASDAYLHHIHPANMSADSFRFPKVTKLSGGVYVAPDGNVWISGVTTDELLRFNPLTGQFAEHATPSTPFGPLHIEAGPQGAYLTATYAHTYAKLDPASGAITVGPPGILEAPVGLDVGGSNLWAGEMGSNNVGHVNLTSGAAEHFPTSPSPYYQISGPAGIRIARDGSIWFVEHFADKIARLDTTNRTLEEWEVPSSPGTNMQYLAEAPDGSFWFAEWSTNKLGHATTDGAQPSFSVPPSVQVTVGQTLRQALSVPGEVIVNGYGNLTTRWDGNALVLDATKAPAGDYNVLVASKDGKHTLGRYVTVHVQTAKGTPGFESGILLATLVLAALARRRT
ncbi:MAG TPA: hypothetical protein VGR28_05000 [Candidatus Thermoplasmatota archaeon]|jgi:virginiamycin B lyase|nr:hypothetical protein [Candidatus Thermoplasmatota archaeon]